MAPYLIGLKFFGHKVLLLKTASLKFTFINFDVRKSTPLKSACVRFVFTISDFLKIEFLRFASVNTDL